MNNLKIIWFRGVLQGFFRHIQRFQDVIGRKTTSWRRSIVFCLSSFKYKRGLFGKTLSAFATDLQIADFSQLLLSPSCFLFSPVLLRSVLLSGRELILGSGAILFASLPFASNTPLLPVHFSSFLQIFSSSHLSSCEFRLRSHQR